MKTLSKKYRATLIDGTASEGWTEPCTGFTFAPDDVPCFEADTLQELQQLAASAGVELDDGRVIALATAAAPAVVVMTPLAVLSRMTMTEEVALTTSTDLAVCIVRQRLIAASEIRSDDPRTAEGAAVLVAKGILTAERAHEVFPCLP